VTTYFVVSTESWSQKGNLYAACLPCLVTLFGVWNDIGISNRRKVISTSGFRPQFWVSCRR